MCAEVAAAATLVFDDHRLTQLLAEIGFDDARRGVDNAARRERNDERDRASWKVLGRGAAG